MRKKGWKQSRHVRKVRTKRGRRKRLVNPKIHKRGKKIMGSRPWFEIEDELISTLQETGKPVITPKEVIWWDEKRGLMRTKREDK